MKKQRIKKHVGFILILFGMFSAGAFAQSESADAITMSKPTMRNKENRISKIQKETEPKQTDRQITYTVFCNCSIVGYGCGANSYCKMACASQCKKRHRAVLQTDESNSTFIAFYLDEPGRASLRIYDVSGRSISVLADQEYAAGENEVAWNRVDVDAGVYFVQLQAGDRSETEKLIITK